MCGNKMVKLYGNFKAPHTTFKKIYGPTKLTRALFTLGCWTQSRPHETDLYIPPVKNEEKTPVCKRK